MHETMQSAYKKHHSTETALLYIQNDILNSIDQNKVVLLVLLDLSAAFDTIDHELLINRLSSRLGLSGCVLDWFRSYRKKIGHKGSSWIMYYQITHYYAMECPKVQYWAPYCSQSMCSPSVTSSKNMR